MNVAADVAHDLLDLHVADEVLASQQDQQLVAAPLQALADFVAGPRAQAVPADVDVLEAGTSPQAVEQAGPVLVLQLALLQEQMGYPALDEGVGEVLADGPACQLVAGQVENLQGPVGLEPVDDLQIAGLGKAALERVQFFEALALL